MKKIVRGNDFVLRLKLNRVTPEGTEGFSVKDSEGLAVRLVGAYCRHTLAAAVSEDDATVVLARVEGDKLTCGRYGIEVVGKLAGDDWRSYKCGEMQIVECDCEADTDLEGDLYEGLPLVSVEDAEILAGVKVKVEVSADYLPLSSLEPGSGEASVQSPAYTINGNTYKGGTASGQSSAAFGQGTTASGGSSHAEGQGTTASGQGSHAEGQGTTASGQGSHAEGQGTTAEAHYSHAEGFNTTVAQTAGPGGHAEGWSSKASGQTSHAEGQSTTASGGSSHAEGNSTTASGGSSHAEGQGTTASGGSSHAEGSGTTASGGSSHAEGSGTQATKEYSHSEGYQTKATAQSAHAEGELSEASGVGAHAEGGSNNYNSSAKTVASGMASHAEGMGTTASGLVSHAEGYYTKASGVYGGHSEGFKTEAKGQMTSHAEGVATTASASGSHAEGVNVETSCIGGHAQGIYNKPSKYALHSIGIGNGNTNDGEGRRNAEVIIALTYGGGTFTEDSYGAYPPSRFNKSGYKYLIGIGGYDGTNLTTTDDSGNETLNTEIKSVQEVIAELQEGGGSATVEAIDVDTINALS